MADQSCYVDFAGGSLVQVFDWLVAHDCPFEYRASDFPIEAINKLQSVIDKQEAEIEEILARTDVLEEELDDAIDRAEEAEDAVSDLEDEVDELTLPSSRRPPPHFPLPAERPSIVNKFVLGAYEGYLIVGTYPNSREVGEIFVKMSIPHVDDIMLRDDAPSEELMKIANDFKVQVSDLTYFLRGILDQLAIAVSIGLQRGIPLRDYIEKFKHTRFPPDGWAPKLGYCSSIIDYIFRWLSARYLDENIDAKESEEGS